MLPLSLTASTHIRYLLRNVNDSNFDSVYKELCEFIGYGTKESILVLQTCFDQLNIDGKDYKNIQLEPIYVSIFRNMLNRPNFSTLLCESVRSLPINEDHLESICKAVQLAAPERIIIGLALTESENHDVRMCGRSFCMTQIAQLCSNHEGLDSVEQIQNILIFLNQSEGLCKHVNSFMEILSLVHSKEDSEFIFAPLVTDEIREINFFRNLEMLNESSDYEFDTILDEMEKELSLADLMSEFGYGCTVNVLQCKEILSLFLPLTEVTVAKIFSTVVCKNFGLGSCQDTYLTFCSAITNSSLSDFPHLDSWNVDVLIESIKQVAPGISWRNVFENFDHEGFHIPNEASFTLLMSIYRHACQEPFPLHAVCSSVWKNAGGQLSFLKHAVSVSPEVFSFAHSGRQLAYIDPVNGHKFHLGHANHAWLCLDLLEVLCLLAERGHAVSVRAMLEYPLKHCPEILLLGMASISTAYNLLQYEVYSAVFPDLLKSTTGASVILHLWHVNPSLLLRGCIDAFSVDQDNITKVLDLCHELKILSLVLEKVPFSFGIRMAALASQKELINLETWLGTNLKTYKDTLFKECLKFIKEVQIRTQPMSPARFNPADSLWNIYCGTISTFLKVLQANAGLISSNNLSEEIEKLSATVMHSSTADNCADDIETDVNSLFHQMFSGELEVDSVILMLTRYKESSEKRDQSLFECMIANLFEEYKFFIKYPERQLKIAAVLFGSLIKHQLVTHLTLGIALRAVLDALRKPADSKMFIFGTKALEQFVDRLIEWPQYCNHILQISHLRGTHSEIIAFIERALARVSSSHSELDLGHVAAVELHQNSIPAVEGTSVPLTGHRGAQITPQISTVQLQERQQSSSEERHKASLPLSSYPKPALSSAIKPSVPTTDTSSTPKSTANVSAASPSSTGFVRPSRPANSTRFGSALSIETLIAASERRETPIQVPTSEIQDKISFIINNLSPANEEAKAKEFSEFLKEQFYPWFAQYLVMRRASIEPNFHDLYIKFLDKVNSKSLNKEIMQASYENCKVLLGSELIKSSVEERSLLKNLGSWLGKLTIGKNQVLRAREIDPKSLIIEAYEKGFMIGVVPFTSRVLEACKNSIAYRPPNPWTMGILALLTEIYAMPNLKMNLKFDIEVLFKNLAVDMKDVVPSSLLKDRTKETEGNPDFSNKDSASSQTSTVSDARTGRVSPLNQVELSHEVASPSHPTVHSHILSQHTASASVHLSAPTLEDEKVAPFSLSDQPPAQGLLQVQSSFPVSQLPTPASSIEQQVVVNPKLHSLGLQRHFLSVLPLIMEQSIKEIVPGIVQRSVSIATQTTKELVLKDYAMESDETRIRNAAHLMVASLAGSLAHVTCKEPLRASIISHLRISVEGLTLANDLLEQAVQIAANDNLDLGCALIEQAATEKAVHSIDGEIAQQLSIRRKQREGVGPAFFDTNLYTQGHIGVLPEALRPKPGRLSHSQQRVYEDFVRLPWQNQSNQTSSPTLVGPSTSVSGGLSQGYSLASGQPSSGLYPTSGNTGVGNAADSLDLGPEELDAGPPLKQSSGSTMRSGLAESVIQQNLDNDATPASASELQYAEHLNTVKESGVSAHTLPSASPSEQFGSMISEPSLTTGDALDKYQLVSEKLESLLANGGTDAEIQAIVSEVCGIILRCISRDEAALAVAQKVFKGLYENESSNAHIGTHIAILAAIRDVSKLVVKELTSWVIYSDEDRKFNTDITVRLIRSDLLNLSEYNIQMAKLLDAGRNKAATDFAISLIQNLVMNKSNVISELHHLVDALAKLATRPGSPDSLHQLVEIARNPSVTAGFVSDIVRKEDNLKYIRDKKQTTGYSAVSREEYNLLDSVEPDPAGFRDQVAMLFAEWYRICELPGAKDGASAHFVLKLLQSGLLKGDDMSDRFFRLLMELSVSHCLQSHQQTQPLSFLAIDIYAALVFSILKFCPVDQGSSKLSLLSKVLAVSVRIIFKDAEERKTSFNPRPYFRLFINWLIDLTTLEPVSDGANLQVMLALANAFHALQPLKLPAFSYAWLELMSHRSFMPKLLTGNLQKGWPCFQRLLVDLFQFLEPFLRNAELGEPVHFLYKGTLRVMLVLLHDFPEFLCDYHFSFCDVIPPSCIQMRNIILSAFPRNMRLPDPSTPNLKIDLLAEITEPPRILSEVDAALRAKQIKSDVDEYLKTQQPGTSFLSELKQKLLLSPSDAARAGFRYNVPLINSLVLYIGVQAIQQLQARSPPHAHGSVSLAAFHVGAALDIFQFLIIELDTEGRYLFLNAIANQLRYPNNHTHYFSFILLYLFAESNQEVIQEQITRVLLERLIVNRPHPWGLLITFIELIKNPRYNFWSRSFTRCAPEIEKLFESVSRLCGGPKPVEEGAGSGLLSDMH